MRILLPPSEGKAEPEGGAPVDLGSLAFAEELRECREAVIRAFDPSLLTAPAAAAAEVYSGVLYQRLQLPELPAAARRRGAKRALIASGLWGFVGLEDRIPHYKLPPSAKLDGIGPLAAHWRPALAVAMADKRGETIVDMRSGAYTAAWKPKHAQLLSVRAFREEKGERKAVSHMAKAVRGDVARALLLARREPKDAEGVASVASDAGFAVELTPTSLDVVI